MMTAKQFAAYLRKVGRHKFHNQPDAIKAGEDEFLNGIGENFTRQEDPEGARWPEHSPITIMIHGVHPLLILTGKMRSAAMGGSGSVRIVKSDGKRMVVQLGISSKVVPYYRKHQDGTRRIPRRRFYFLHRSKRPSVVRAIQTKVRAKIRGDLKWR